MSICKMNSSSLRIAERAEQHAREVELAHARAVLNSCWTWTAFGRWLSALRAMPYAVSEPSATEVATQRDLETERDDD